MCIFVSSWPHPKSLKVLLLSRICLSDGSQLSDFRLLLVFGESWPVGVNIIHR